jgi:hypothetical protein
MRHQSFLLPGFTVLALATLTWACRGRRRASVIAALVSAVFVWSAVGSSIRYRPFAIPEDLHAHFAAFDGENDCLLVEKSSLFEFSLYGFPDRRLTIDHRADRGWGPSVALGGVGFKMYEEGSHEPHEFDWNAAAFVQRCRGVTWIAVERSDTVPSLEALRGILEPVAAAMQGAAVELREFAGFPRRGPAGKAFVARIITRRAS